MPHLQHSSSCSPDLATKQLVGGPEDTGNRGEEEEKKREREKEKRKRSEAGDAKLGWCCIVCIAVYTKKDRKIRLKKHSGLSFAGDGHVMIH